VFVVSLAHMLELEILKPAEEAPLIEQEFANLQDKSPDNPHNGLSHFHYVSIAQSLVQINEQLEQEKQELNTKLLQTQESLENIIKEYDVCLNVTFI
jgi:hypothetical protein